MSTTPDSYEQAVDRLHEVLDIDVLNQTHGRLYFGDMYIECYVIASKKSEWEYDAGYMDVELTVVVLFGENSYTYGISSNDNKRYPSIHTGMQNGMTSNYIINPHFTDSNFQLIIYRCGESTGNYWKHAVSGEYCIGIRGISVD